MKQCDYVTGFNLHHGHQAEGHEVSQEICHVPGFTVLQWLLPKHNCVTEVYILLMALLLGQAVTSIPADVTVSLLVCSVLFHHQPTLVLISGIHGH